MTPVHGRETSGIRIEAGQVWEAPRVLPPRPQPHWSNGIVSKDISLFIWLLKARLKRAWRRLVER